MRITVRTVSSNNRFICYVPNIYDKICEFISREWIDTKGDSVRAFATNHDIDEKTVRRIVNWKTTPYQITIYTLEKICSSRDITLEEFFKMIKR